MISLNDYTSHDGLGLAELVARKEVTPEELVAAALAAVEKVNPRLNAVLQTLPAQASAEIRIGLPRGPFTGVPFLIKELLLHARNVRCDMGSRLAQGFVSPEDTELMARFRRAGLVLVGTTQTPEFGYGPSAETVLHGPVHNPWDLTRSAGGLPVGVQLAGRATKRPSSAWPHSSNRRAPGPGNDRPCTRPPDCRDRPFLTGACFAVDGGCSPQ